MLYIEINSIIKTINIAESEIICLSQKLYLKTIASKLKQTIKINAEPNNQKVLLFNEFLVIFLINLITNNIRIRDNANIKIAIIGVILLKLKLLKSFLDKPRPP